MEDNFPGYGVDDQNIAVQGGYVYYLTLRHLVRVPVLGGPEQIVANEPLNPVPSSTSLVAGVDSVFFEGASGIFRVTNGETTLLAPSTHGTTGRRLAVAGNDLVIVRQSPPNTVSISKIPQTGGTEVLLDSYQGDFTTVTADTSSAYVAGSNGIYEIPLTGDAPKLRTTRPVFGGPWSLAVDNHSLYTSFANSSSLFDVDLGVVDPSGAFTPFARASAVNIQFDDQRLFVLGNYVDAGHLRSSIFTLRKGVPLTQNPPVRVIRSGLIAADAGNFGFGRSALAITGQQIFFLDDCDNVGGGSGPYYALVTVGKDFQSADPSP